MKYKVLAKYSNIEHYSKKWVKFERSSIEKDYNKEKVIINFIKEHGEITHREAENITKKFTATERRYFKMLVDTEWRVIEGSSNNSKYYASVKLINGM